MKEINIKLSDHTNEIKCSHPPTKEDLSKIIEMLEKMIEHNYTSRIQKP